MRFKSIELFALPLFLSLSSGTLAAESDVKKTVCSITINSDEEIKVFKKHLGSKFNFVELISGESDWLKSACRQGIQCDVLVVSGHFGGAFFGKSGERLSIEEMERLSCSDCPGIFRKPKEVFLFGCNTLAGKGSDTRSFEEYVRVLVTDGFSASEANLIAEARYGGWGASFGERMQAVFSGVPRIYGFHSVGPSGKNVEGMLSNYVKSVRNYSSHLDNIKYNVFNEDFSKALKGTYQAQVSGSDIGEAGQSFRCSLHSDLSRVAKLEKVIEHLDTHDIVPFIPALTTFFDSNRVEFFNGTEKGLLQRIGDNQRARTRVLQLLDMIKSPYLLVDMIQLSYKLGWVSEELRKERIGKLLYSILNQEFISREGLDVLSSLAHKYGSSTRDSLDLGSMIGRRGLTASFTDPRFLYALGLLQPKDPEIMRSILDVLESNPEGSHLFKTALSAIESSETKDPATLSSLIKYLDLKYDDTTAKAVARIIRIGRVQEMSAVKALSRILKSSKSASRREMAAVALSLSMSNSVAIQALRSAAAQDPTPSVRYQAVDALRMIMNDSLSIFQMGKELLKTEKDSEVRSIIIYTIGQLSAPDAELDKILVGIINSSASPDERKQAVQGLTNRHRENNSAPYLKLFLQVLQSEKEYEVIMAAVYGLQNIDGLQHPLKTKTLNQMIQSGHRNATFAEKALQYN